MKSLLCLLLAALPASAENWTRWRGPDGNPSSGEVLLPKTWSATKNVLWKMRIPGEGMSSPIVWDDYVFITWADEKGTHRYLDGLSRKTGKTLWTYTVDCDNPELATAAVGHAASTPATDGAYVVAFFGNAGVFCCDLDGKPLWRTPVGEFDGEGVVSSPIIFGDLVILACDARGKAPNSLESSLIALDKKTGKVVWKTQRPGLKRPATTPIIVPAPNVKREVVVAAQNELRGYDTATGDQLWRVDNSADWGAPTPVYGFDTIFVAGKDALMLTVKTGGNERGQLGWKQPPDDVEVLPGLKKQLERREESLEMFKKNITIAEYRKANPELTDEKIAELMRTDEQEIKALSDRIAAAEKAPKADRPRLASPVLYRSLLFANNEQGEVACFDALSMTMLFRQRLEGKFAAPAVAGNGMVYLSNEAGTTFVLKADPSFELLAVNTLDEPIRVTPAISHGCLFFRTDKHLWCIERGEEPLK
jgi:outer membrane protein assembly factor BamB